LFLIFEISIDSFLKTPKLSVLKVSAAVSNSNLQNIDERE